jgi:hypothetical protein
MKNGFFCSMALVRNDISEEGEKNLRSVLQSLVTANTVPILLILLILITEVPCSSETLVLARVIQCHIPADGILLKYFQFNKL